jgi:uncharacterized protein (TIGR00369 family)
MALPETSHAQVHPRVAALVDEILVRSPAAQLLGIQLECLEVDRVVMRLPFRESNVVHGGVVHGGVIAALIDSVGAAASMSGAGESFNGGATSSMSISYLEQADRASLTAEAVTVRRGRSQNVSDVTVRLENGKIAAKALVTCRLFRNEAT